MATNAELHVEAIASGVSTYIRGNNRWTILGYKAEGKGSGKKRS